MQRFFLIRTSFVVLVTHTSTQGRICCRELGRTSIQLMLRVKGATYCARVYSVSNRLLCTYYKEAHIDGNTAQQFADRAQIEVRGGKGGNGCISHEILSPGRKRPSGGSGGKGGNVFIVGDPQMYSLKFNTYHFNGENGKHGGSQGMTGRSGRDVFIRVPLGTVVTERVPDEYSGHYPLTGDDDNVFDDLELEEQQEEAGEAVGQGSDSGDGNGWELLPEDQVVDRDSEGSLKEPFHVDDSRTVLLVARGGAPGVGNKASMRSKSAPGAGGGATQRLQSTPKTYLPGQHGEHRSLLLELKLIADVGLVGFPNAGKSSLLRALSNAQPKVASYKFTTLHPSIGVVEYSDLGRITVADIPGLIEGAHEDKGLGHDFLRHIERTKLLLYVLDASASERGRTPAMDLQALVEELGMYDAALLEKPALIFANKYDLDVSAKHRRALDKAAAALGLEILPGSALEGNGIALLARRLREKLHNAVSVSARPGVDERDGEVKRRTSEEALDTTFRAAAEAPATAIEATEAVSKNSRSSARRTRRGRRTAMAEKSVDNDSAEEGADEDAIEMDNAMSEDSIDQDFDIEGELYNPAPAGGRRKRGAPRRRGAPGSSRNSDDKDGWRNWDDWNVQKYL